MTFTDFIKDLIDSGKERIKSPITSTYFIFFVIYNWRPILVMIFSDKSIENKIIEINEEYCSVWAFSLPLIYTFLYLILLPIVSAGLEKLLFAPTSYRRLTKNKEKIDIVNNKISLASAELLLQDKLSRNQEIKEMLEKVNELESKNLKDKEIHSALANDYKEQITELTENLARANERNMNERQKLQEELIILNEAINKEKKNVVQLELDLKSSQDSLRDWESTKYYYEDKINESINEIEHYRSVFQDKKNKEFYSDVENIPPSIISKAGMLHIEGEWKNFLDVAKFIAEGGIFKGRNMREMKKLDLIYYESEDSMKDARLTPIGQILWDFRDVLNNII